MPHQTPRTCDCDGCRRIRDLDSAASVAGEPEDFSPSDWGLDDWMLDENDSPRPAAPQVAPSNFARTVRDFSAAAEVIAAASRANSRPDVLQIVEAAERCSDCGITAEPYAVEDRLVCEGCYRAAISRLYSCHQCSTHLQPGDCYDFIQPGEQESFRYCRDCIRQLQDYCNGCGNIGPRNSMRRDTRGRCMCRGCYRPEWKQGEWKPERNTYNLVPRGFTYGVELETSNSENYADLEGQTSWGCVPEASTSGREFVSPVLKGDAGLQEVANFIQKWGDEWEVDNYCGTHIHIGLHKFSLDQKRRIAYAYHCAWSFIAAMIGPQRSQNSMCGAPQWTLADLMMAGDIEDFAEARDRFEFVNWRSLLKYGTIEIRCLKGTLDANLINPWIRWHCNFIKKVASMSMGKLQKAMSTDANLFCEQIDPAVVEQLHQRMGVRRANPLDLAAAVPSRFRLNRNRR